MVDEQMPLFVPPGHFYSPVVDTDEAAAYFEKKGRAGAVKSAELCNIEEMKKFWEKNVPGMIATQEMILANSGSTGYHFDNGFFDYGDVLVYGAMIDEYQPRRIIEVGAGYSSAFLVHKVKTLGVRPEVLLIEPHPEALERLICIQDYPFVRLLREKIQDVDLTEFETLAARDILFIDGSHVVKTGSDAFFELFEILPMLQSGVIIHFHDVFHDFEYPREWVIQENRSWNEIYFLRQMLTLSADYEIIFFNDLFSRRCEDLVRRSSCVFQKNPGGSLWLRKS